MADVDECAIGETGTPCEVKVIEPWEKGPRFHARISQVDMPVDVQLPKLQGQIRNGIWHTRAAYGSLLFISYGTST